MFGWEYPPHVYGGLATANFGISQGLHAQGDVETVLCSHRGVRHNSCSRLADISCRYTCQECQWQTIVYTRTRY